MSKTDYQEKMEKESAEKGGYISPKNGRANIDNLDDTRSCVILNCEQNPQMPGSCAVWSQYEPNADGSEAQHRSRMTFQFALGPKDSEGRWKVPGITVEELIAAATLRLRDLNNQCSDPNNEKAIESLKDAQKSLALRRQDRKNRGILGESQS